MEIVVVCSNLLNLAILTNLQNRLAKQIFSRENYAENVKISWNWPEFNMLITCMTIAICYGMLLKDRPGANFIQL